MIKVHEVEIFQMQLLKATALILFLTVHGAVDWKNISICYKLGSTYVVNDF